LVIGAFSSVFPTSVASTLISISILTFCLSTQIGFYIYYETSVVNLFGKKAPNYLRWVYLLPGVIFAGIAYVDRLWVFANISVGVCSLPNLVALIALSGGFFRLMKDYLLDKNEYTTSIVDSKRNYVKTA
jgi:AGCS family alanine or glycine:cation symporter